MATALNTGSVFQHVLWYFTLRPPPTHTHTALKIAKFGSEQTKLELILRKKKFGIVRKMSFEKKKGLLRFPLNVKSFFYFGRP